MRKGMLGAGVVVALLTLSLAGGGTAVGAGDDATALRGAGGAFEISFSLRTRDGEPVALKRFRFSHLEAACDAGQTATVRGRIRSIPINDRNRFSKTVRRNGKRVRVKGRVTNDLEKVFGTIRVQGDFGTAVNCDSGRVHWQAN
jgi:hypothetical protein